NPNSRVVRVERLPNRNNEILLVGENPGRSLVTFVDQNDRVEVHEVVVAFQGEAVKKMTITKGGTRTVTLDKPALGGAQVTVGGVVRIVPTEKPNVFSIEAVAPGNTRVTSYADIKRTEVLAVYDLDVPMENRVT